MKTEARLKPGRWGMAELLAQVFEKFRDARVYRITERRAKGLRIDLFTDKEVAARLTRQAPPHGAKPVSAQAKSTSREAAPR